MPDDFRWNDKGVRQFRKDLKKLGKRQMRYAMAGFLTQMAWAGKNKFVPDALQDGMNIRDEKFMNQQIRVKKAKPSDGIRQMEAVVGTAAVGKFRGWEEQQTGKAKKDRSHTLAAQVGNSEKGKISPSKRLKRGTQLIEPLKIGGKYHKTPGQRTVRALHNMRSGKAKRMVQLSRRGFVGRLNRLKSGAYMGQRGKVRRIWNFEEKQTTKKITWMNTAMRRQVRKVDAGRIWKKEVKRQIKFMKRR